MIYKYNNYVKTDGKESLIKYLIHSFLASIAGIIIIPTLSILCFAFAVIGIALPGVSLLNLLHITNIPFNILFMQVKGIPQLIIAVTTGLIFLIWAFMCGVGLRKYFSLAKKIMR